MPPKYNEHGDLVTPLGLDGVADELRWHANHLLQGVMDDLTNWHTVQTLLADTLAQSIRHRLHDALWDDAVTRMTYDSDVRKAARKAVIWELRRDNAIQKQALESVMQSPAVRKKAIETLVNDPEIVAQVVEDLKTLRPLQDRAVAELKAALAGLENRQGRYQASPLQTEEIMAAIDRILAHYPPDTTNT